MIEITNTEVFGWNAAIRGMRNAHESWEKSDSHYECREYEKLSEYNHKTYLVDNFVVGPNDLKLMKQLVAAGTDHSKFMRMIHVQCDWEAPLYWWKEADTYKVGTVRNSCSTMHMIAEREFTMDDFSHEHLFGPDDMLPYDRRDDISKDRVLTAIDIDGATCYYTPKGLLQMIHNALNFERERYLAALKTEEETGLSAKDIWWQMIQLLPSSYNQKATMDLNYATLRNMYHSRKNHKLDEWRIDFCNWVKSLPYSELITMTKEELLESIKEE